MTSLTVFIACLVLPIAFISVACSPVDSNIVDTIVENFAGVFGESPEVETPFLLTKESETTDASSRIQILYTLGNRINGKK